MLVGNETWSLDYGGEDSTGVCECDFILSLAAPAPLSPCQVKLRACVYESRLLGAGVSSLV
jgi:hypothetical protein